MLCELRAANSASATSYVQQRRRERGIYQKAEADTGGAAIGESAGWDGSTAVQPNIVSLTASLLNGCNCKQKATCANAAEPANQNKGTGRAKPDHSSSPATSCQALQCPTAGICDSICW
jgi:hypothetical protein